MQDPERQGTGCKCRYHARPRETRYWLQMQVGLCVPLNPPPLAHRGSWNVWVVNNYQRRSKPLNVWNVIHHATNVSMSPECDSPIVWHPGAQLMLGQHRQLVQRNLPKVTTPPGDWTRDLLRVKQACYHYTTGPVWRYEALKLACGENRHLQVLWFLFKDSRKSWLTA